jgi:citrate lyase subunit beta / citryl-CoA lyase
MKLRSLFLVRGDSQSGIAKAAMLLSDALILDLYAVDGAKAKTAARNRIVGWIGGKRRRGLMVRIHAPGDEHYFEDLSRLVPARPAALVLPQWAETGSLAALDHHLAALEAANGQPRGGIKVLAAVETLAALESVERTDARNLPSRVIALCFGADEIGAELGLTPRGADGSYRAPLLQTRTRMLMAAAAGGLAAIDGPFHDPHDSKGLAREIRVAAEDGYAGKLCVLPAQVAPVTAAFTSSPEQAEWARRVTRLLEAEPDGRALRLDGKVIAPSQLHAARRILSAFE